MIIQKVPQTVYEQRLRRACKSCKKKACDFTDDYKYRLHFSLFITNILQEIWNGNQILECYKLRWQIELIFKNWKSIEKIDQVKKVKQCRFESHLLISLLYLLLIWQMLWYINIRLYTESNCRKMLSFYKVCIHLRQESQQLHSAIKEGSQSLIEYIIELYKISEKKFILETKKKKTSLYDLIGIL